MIDTEEYLWHMHNIPVIYCKPCGWKQPFRPLGCRNPQFAQRPARLTALHGAASKADSPSRPAAAAALAFLASVFCPGGRWPPWEVSWGTLSTDEGAPGPVQGPTGRVTPRMDSQELRPQKKPKCLGPLPGPQGASGCGTDPSFCPEQVQPLPPALDPSSESIPPCLGKKSSLQEKPSLPQASEHARGLMPPHAPTPHLRCSGEGGSEVLSLSPALRRGVALNSVMKTQPSPNLSHLEIRSWKYPFFSSVW